MNTTAIHRCVWAAMFAALVCALFVAEVGCQDATVAPKAFERTSPGQPSAPSAPQADASTMGTGDLYALVVGVSKYKHHRIKQLKVAGNDAKDFARFLDTQKKVFKTTHVKLLINEDATKQAIEKHLQYELPKAGKDDTVVLFLSGHGADDPKMPNDYFFLSHDADPDYLASTSVKMNAADFLKRIASRRVLVIADACHSGGIPEVRTRSWEKSLASFMRNFGESSGRVIMSSSGPDEYSQEKPNLPNGVFTYYLLRALQGEADSDRNGVVDVNEAYRYVHDRTKDETGGAQHPELAGTVQGTFPISVTGQPGSPIKLEVSFFAQDPRCTNSRCTDPTPDVTSCDDPQCGDVPLRNGDTMYSRQNYQIAVKPSETCYLYVYHVGNQGGIFRLFPGKELLAPENLLENPVKGGAICWLPGKNNWLRQDDTLGEEKIYVVASRSKNTALEDLYTHLERVRNQGGSAPAAKEAQEKLHGYINTMMPARILPAKVASSAAAQRDRKIRSFEELATIFEAPGLDAVESVSFTHKAR